MGTFPVFAGERVRISILGIDIVGPRLIPATDGGIGVTDVRVIWDDDLAHHPMAPHHPLDPKRLALTIELMKAYGLVRDAEMVLPRRATVDEIQLVHRPGYVELVMESSDWGTGLHAGSGLGTDDNPIYPGMHDASAFAVGASIVAMEQVLTGRARRTVSISGGLHHAHRARAAGFCVYNDAAVAIEVARQHHPGLRVLYIDVDAHHGDGVEEVFAFTKEVMTISVHESGLWLFPGSGFSSDVGYGDGEGFAANVPLPPLAGDDCYRLAFEQVVEPLARAFAPDVIVGQFGADAHHEDPLTDLGLTLPGYRWLVEGIARLSDELCGGKLVALGGGGYNFGVVPRAWTSVLAILQGATVEEQIPEAWRSWAPTLGLSDPPRTMGSDDTASEIPAERASSALEGTIDSIRQTREAVFPHHGLEP